MNTLVYGQQFRRARTEAKVTLREISRKVGLTISSVAKREMGTVAIREDELPRFCAALGITEEELHRRAMAETDHGFVTVAGIPVKNRDARGIDLDYREHALDQPSPSDDGAKVVRGDVQSGEAFAIAVANQDNEPVFKVGDTLIFVPLSPKRPAVLPGACVFIKFSPGTRVKHAIGFWETLPAGKVKLTFKNPRTQAITFDLSEVVSVAILAERRHTWV